MAQLQLSINPLYQKFAERTLSYTLYGGADFGECLQTMNRINDLGDDQWYTEWCSTASKLEETGDKCLKNNHLVSARESYLRATNYYRTSYSPLFGLPVDKGLIAAFTNETRVFQKACKLINPPVETLEIPFENKTLPAYFIKVDDSLTSRPTLIHTNGYDSNIQEMFFAHAIAAKRRGYNCLLFDGPGQGRNIIRDKMPLRHDWENVIKYVVDYALTRQEVHSKKIALVGWSFGGFLAPRAAAFEDRISALIADPGQWDFKEAILDILPLSEEEKWNFPNIDQEKFKNIEYQLRHDKKNALLKWSMIQRGFWVNNTTTLFDYINEMLKYEISPVVKQIKCPTLLTYSEDDPTAKGILKLYENLNCKKKVIKFKKSEGGGGHCQMLARSLYHQRVFDWLDDLFKKQ